MNKAWEVDIDGAGSWSCEHVDSEGRPAPSTHLFVDTTDPCEVTDRSAQKKCRTLQCVDCGTYWRAWERLRIAKAYAACPYSHHETATGVSPSPHRYRRTPVRDIDRIIEMVRLQIPDLVVRQHGSTWPGNDDGIWFFRAPGVRSDIQIESPYGSSPFLVETDEQSSTTETVEDTANAVLAYLKS